jgi:preprotein translocase subunit Sec61beta
MWRGIDGKDEEFIEKIDPKAVVIARVFASIHI